MVFLRSAAIVLTVSCCVVLLGCGGGGGESTTASPGGGGPAPTPAACAKFEKFDLDWDSEQDSKAFNNATYKAYLQTLDAAALSTLYTKLKTLMTSSNACWPADGPQDGDVANYAGLFGRLAWHCAGSLRVLQDGSTQGGCEGGRIRFWPEREWRDNANLDKALNLLTEIKAEYPDLSWGDLITFAGTVGIHASGGPVKKFCFGRVDEKSGKSSLMLGTEGVTQCKPAYGDCATMTHAKCTEKECHADQDPTDHGGQCQCKLAQQDGRFQGSHSVGLIYVFPQGPKLKDGAPGHDPTLTHQRSATLSAKDVEDTFVERMGWTVKETVALIAGGHSLGRSHGNCPNKADDGVTCIGATTSTSGFEGPWTNTPSKWSHEYFTGLYNANWTPSKSPEGADQWGTDSETFKKTFRLTADMAMKEEPFKMHTESFRDNETLFKDAFADVWYKLTHRSEKSPDEDSLAANFEKCFDEWPTMYVTI